jgi:methylase of polypeptide subunit release factors
MQETLLNSISQATALSCADVKTYSPHEIFFCPEESQFYAQCLEKMVLTPSADSKTVIEFGAGDGSPVISGLLKTKFQGSIHGYELGVSACEVAWSRIKQYHLTGKYTVHNQCFFEGVKSTPANYLIANPPYLPAPDDRICMPALHGGIDGATITNRLLSVGCSNVMLMISAYSNPVETVYYALEQGYRVADFMVTPLRFGYYSSEPKVKNWITELRKQRKAFYSTNVYFLAGVLFQKQPLVEADRSADLSKEFIKVITAL